MTRQRISFTATGPPGSTVYADLFADWLRDNWAQLPGTPGWDISDPVVETLPDPVVHKFHVQITAPSEIQIGHKQITDALRNWAILGQPSVHVRITTEIPDD